MNLNYTNDELIEIIKHCTNDDDQDQCKNCPAEDGGRCDVACRGYCTIPKDLLNHVIDALSDDDNSNYKRGLNDAWDVCRKVLLCEDDGGVPPSDIKEIFGITGFTFVGSCTKLLKDHTAEEAIEKINKYYEAFHVGDEVVFGSSHINGVVTKITPYGAMTLRVLDKNGFVHLVYPESSGCKKTGRHLNEVEELLKLIEDGEDEDG